MSREPGTVVEHPQFSNGSEYEMWACNYCQECWYDREVNRHGNYEKGCEWHARMFYETVDVLVYTEDNPVGIHCLKFTPDDGSEDKGIPEPPPQIAGQLSMDDLADADLGSGVGALHRVAPAPPSGAATRSETDGS